MTKDKKQKIQNGVKPKFIKAIKDSYQQAFITSCYLNFCLLDYVCKDNCLDSFSYEEYFSFINDLVQDFKNNKDMPFDYSEFYKKAFESNIN